MTPAISFDWMDDALICNVYHKFLDKYIEAIVAQRPNSIILHHCEWPGDLSFINGLPIRSISIQDPVRALSLNRINRLSTGDLPIIFPIMKNVECLTMTARAGVIPCGWSHLKRLEIWDIKKQKMADLSKMKSLDSLEVKGNNSISELHLSGTMSMSRVTLCNCPNLSMVSINNVKAIDYLEVDNCRKIDMSFVKGLMLKSIIISGLGHVCIETNGKPLHMGGSGSLIHWKPRQTS